MTPARMEKVVSAVTLLCVVGLCGCVLGQDTPRPVVPLSTGRSDLSLSQRLQQEAATLHMSPQERERYRLTLIDRWQASDPARLKPESVQSGVMQRPETGSKIKYPPPGANAPNTMSETTPRDDAEDGDTATAVADDSKVINAAVRQFALDVLTKLTIASPEANIIVSPFSVWTVLLAILEGAQGHTADQIKTALGLPRSRNKIRRNFKKLDSALQVSGTSVVFESANGLFSDAHRPVLSDYSERLTTIYRCKVIPLNFSNPQESFRVVNRWVSESTRYRIMQLVKKEELSNPQLIVANAVYFKGKWKWPFNSTATAPQRFFNERNEALSSVPMMYQSGAYLYSFIAEINAHVLDMPYVDGKFRMLVILPKPGNNLRQVLHDMKQFPVDACYDRLVHEQEMFADDVVHVYIPRFKFSNKHQLGDTLQSMGIVDLFDEQKANLSGINAQNGVYLGQVLQVAEIEVNEEGTVASAASGGMFINKAGPPKFIANRPFAFFIVENSQRTVIFAGKVYNPNSAM